jgi:hypothetical protein
MPSMRTTYDEPPRRLVGAHRDRRSDLVAAEVADHNRLPWLGGHNLDGRCLAERGAAARELEDIISFLVPGLPKRVRNVFQ